MMNNLVEEEINHYLRDLFSESQEVRVNAINQLGDMGDELCLDELREQLKYIDNEHKALKLAIEKLKKKFEV